MVEKISGASPTDPLRIQQLMQAAKSLEAVLKPNFLV